ncbi:major facilitator superfamily domain-containing protein [Mycena leptocephala]|nr:major facilitator superfamily domain-containing protein [Mycena leptocephala]
MTMTLSQPVHLDKTDHMSMSSEGTGKPQFQNIDAVLADTDAAAYVDHTIVIDAATNTRLLKIVNRRILPLMCLAYLCQALDKSTTATASIMGLRPDTHMTGQDYALTSTFVWIGIIVGEFPANRAIQVFPAAKLLGASMIIWGLLLIPSGLILDYRPLFAFRFLLGFFESVIAPCLLAITVMWYKKSEQPLVSAAWQCMLGANNAISGLLGYAFFHVTHAGLKSWQILFLILPDSPARARMYSEEDKKLFVERVRSNDQGIKNKVYNSYQAREVMYFLLFFQNTLIVGGIGTFGSILINGSFGFSALSAYSSTSWGIPSHQDKQTILMMFLFTVPASSAHRPHCPHQRPHPQRPPVRPLLPYVPALMHPSFSFYLMQSFGAQNPMITGMLLSRNVAGQTKKTYAYAITFLGWAGGNAIAPQSSKPSGPSLHQLPLDPYRDLLHLHRHTCIHARLLMRRNAVKDRAQAEKGGANEHLHAFEDLTDLQNPDFRYSY